MSCYVLCILRDILLDTNTGLEILLHAENKDVDNFYCMFNSLDAFRFIAFTSVKKLDRD